MLKMIIATRWMNCSCSHKMNDIIAYAKSKIDLVVTLVVQRTHKFKKGILRTFQNEENVIFTPFLGRKRVSINNILT